MYLFPFIGLQGVSGVSQTSRHHDLPFEKKVTFGAYHPSNHKLNDSQVPIQGKIPRSLFFLCCMSVSRSAALSVMITTRIGFGQYSWDYLNVVAASGCSYATIAKATLTSTQQLGAT